MIGTHDLSPGSKSPITGARPGSCSYCHAPHSGLATGTPLWNQTQTKATYQLYTSTTYHQKGQQPMLGSDSNLCLSCHDGTVAVGNTIVSGQITMTGSMNAQDVFGTNLQSSHPFSLQLPIKDTIDLIASLASQGKTGDPLGKVKLINGNIECTSCHNPHVQAIDTLVAELSGARQLEGADVSGLPRSQPDDLKPGQSSGGMEHQRARSGDEQSCAGGEPGQLRHGRPATPASPATRRTMRWDRRACCTGRTSRTAPAATTAARISLRPSPTCLPSSPRSGIRFPQETIPTMPPKMCC